MLTLVLFVVVTALVFEYINGFHDAANAIATAPPIRAPPVINTALPLGSIEIFDPRAD